jgi:protein-S-isoprenylcysteine O-methyltransferase Ste14
MNMSATIIQAAPRNMLGNLLTRRFAANYLSTLALMCLAWWFIFHLSGFHRSFLSGSWHLGSFGSQATLSVQGLFTALFVAYALILIPYYAAYPWLHSKSFAFARGLWFAFRRAPRTEAAGSANPMRLLPAFRLSRLSRQAGLTLLLKFFFAPLMINWCLMHIANLTGSMFGVVDALDSGTRGRLLFDNHIFWAVFQLLLFTDTLLFTIGYIVELPGLDNRIRSVEPTFFGWFICLICYPPFIDFTLRFFEWQSSDFPLFENTAVHFAVNITLLLAMTVFAWSSLSLGFKASNLTNRGIVRKGPYRFVRHPAYAAKNFAWWLGALPTLGVFLYAGNWQGLAYSLIALAGWSAIYVLRALTEERHLRLLDNGYAQYAEQVRWRFIPGVW